MKMELHIHTKYSKDSMLGFWILYLKCRLLKIDCVAVTEHNNVKGGQEFERFCKKHGSKVTVIVGEEIYTEKGEIIGLYLYRQIEPRLSAEETIAEIKFQEGIVYIPHPYDEKRKKTVLQESVIMENSNKIDCIEVHNGRNISVKYDEKQASIANRYGIAHVIGSDAHTWIEVGRNYMEKSDCVPPESANEFRRFIKGASFHSKKCIQLAHSYTAIVKMLKMIGMGKLNEVYKLISSRFEKTKW